MHFSLTTKRQRDDAWLTLPLMPYELLRAVGRYSSQRRSCTTSLPSH